MTGGESARRRAGRVVVFDARRTGYHTAGDRGDESGEWGGGVPIDATVVITFTEAIDAPTLTTRSYPIPAGGARRGVTAAMGDAAHDAFAEIARVTVTVSTADDLAAIRWWMHRSRGGSRRRGRVRSRFIYRW